MFPSAMSCARVVHTSALRKHHHFLIRNVFVRSVSSQVWNPAKASFSLVSVQKKPVDSFRSSAMNKYCTKVNSIPVVEYAEVKDLPNHPEKLLIDVREPGELEATGIIPTAINIPLGIVGQELASQPNEFQKKYGRSTKPSPDTCIIMHCRIGKRSQDAAQIAAALGYKNVHNYVGSWLDWADREGLSKES